MFTACDTDIQRMSLVAGSFARFGLASAHQPGDIVSGPGWTSRRTPVTRPGAAESPRTGRTLDAIAVTWVNRGPNRNRHADPPAQTVPWGESSFDHAYAVVGGRAHIPPPEPDS